MKRYLLLCLPAAFVLATSGACDPPDKGQLDRVETDSTHATEKDFLNAGVGLVFEKRCGSLDCHGSAARNMRIYSASGLRLPNDAGRGPGGADTTNEERLANYQAILTLEPKATYNVLHGGDPYSMLVVKKPLAIEHHKGGAVIRRGDDAEECIISWLSADPDAGVATSTDSCAKAAIFPKE